MQHIHQLASDAAEAASSNNTRALHQITRELTPCHKRKPVMVILENGQHASDCFEVRNRWQRHFAKKLCGHNVDFEDLLQSALSRQRDGYDRSASIEFSSEY
eukprot:9148272-Karenia_brevis.AAC.1